MAVSSASPLSDVSDRTLLIDGVTQLIPSPGSPSLLKSCSWALLSRTRLLPLSERSARATVQSSVDGADDVCARQLVDEFARCTVGSCHDASPTPSQTLAPPTSLSRMVLGDVSASECQLLPRELQGAASIRQCKPLGTPTRQSPASLSCPEYCPTAVSACLPGSTAPLPDSPRASSGAFDEIEETSPDPRAATNDHAVPRAVDADHPQSGMMEWMLWREGDAGDGPESPVAGSAPGGVLSENDSSLSSAALARCVVDLVEARADMDEHPTLVVVPPARLELWADTLRLHAHLQVIVHHGAQRIRNAAKFSRAHCVLTTYGMLTATEVIVRDVPRVAGVRQPTRGALPLEEQWRIRLAPLDRERRGAGSRGGLQDKHNAERPSSSLLHVARWERVVFDDSDRLLANPSTARGRAAARLRANKRWALTSAAVHAKPSLLDGVLSCCGVQRGDDYHWAE
mmetsp:Transcript_28143/g.82705  ORF Transcript_28143/g.82705 Transcript_28143/m.82705 type:complete len:457 (-) Transcript_28143:140-1510(-)